MNNDDVDNNNFSRSCAAILGHGSKMGMDEHCFVFDPTTGDVGQVAVDTCADPPEDQILVGIHF